MALSDEQEKKLLEELESSKAQLKALQEAQAKEQLERDDTQDNAEKKRVKEKPVKPVLDPDIAKQIVSQEERIKKLEARLGTGSEKKSGGLFNLFG